MNKLILQGFLKFDAKTGLSAAKVPWARVVIETDVNGYKQTVDAVTFKDVALLFEGRQKGDFILVTDATVRTKYDPKTKQSETMVVINEVEFEDQIKEKKVQTHIQTAKEKLGGTRLPISQDKQEDLLDVPF